MREDHRRHQERRTGLLLGIDADHQHLGPAHEAYEDAGTPDRDEVGAGEERAQASQPMDGAEHGGYEAGYSATAEAPLRGRTGES